MAKALATLILTLAALASASGVARADAPECAAPAVAGPKQRAAQLTTALKLANFRADLPYLRKVRDELRALIDPCWTDETLHARYAALCGYDCHLQIARAYLFEASDLPWLYSKQDQSSSDDLASPGDKSHGNDLPSPGVAAQIAVTGLAYVDRGEGVLAKQQGIAAGTEEQQEQTTFREYVRQATQLRALKIRLYMAVGDNYYQTVSDVYVKRLAGAAPSGDESLGKALTNYEAAMWTVIDALGDIPGGDDTYDGARLDIMTLKTDVRARIDSAEHGYLFLGIDPEAFTNITFPELEAKLKDLTEQVDRIEGAVDAIVKDWHAKNDVQAVQNVDEQRYVTSESVELHAHKIGKIEAESAAYANSMQQKLAGLQKESTDFGTRKAIRDLEEDVKQEQAETAFRLAQLQQRTENDLVALDIDRERERREELRWLLNYEMSVANMKLQTDALAVQIAEYNRQLDRDRTHAKQVDDQVKEHDASIAMANSRIAAAEAQIKAIDAERGEIFAKKREADRMALCHVETQLRFLGANPTNPVTPACPQVAVTMARRDYQRLICGDHGNDGLRHALSANDVDFEAFVSVCVLNNQTPVAPDGSAVSATFNCAGMENDIDTAKKLHDAQHALADQEMKDAGTALEHATKELDDLKQAIQDFKDAKVSVDSVIAAAEGTYVALSAIPTTIIGLAAGTVEEPDKVAKAIWDTAKDTADRALSAANTAITMSEALERLEAAARQAAATVAQLRLQQNVDAIAYQRTVFQLRGRARQADHDVRRAFLQDELVIADCQAQGADVEQAIAVAQADHDRLMATLEMDAAQNDNLVHQREIQVQTIAQARSEIHLHELQQDELKEEQQAIDRDMTAVADIQRRVADRQQALQNTMDHVDGLATESSKESRVIEELQKKQEAGLLALDKDESTYLQGRLKDKEAYASASVAQLNAQIQTLDAQSDLQKLLLEQQATLMKAAESERVALMAELSKEAVFTGEKGKIYEASEEDLADMLRGIPEYLAAKVSAMETANATLHLMRQRYATLAALTGDDLATEAVFVRTSADLAKAWHGIAKKNWFNEKQVTIGAAEIDVPASSGLARALVERHAARFELAPGMSPQLVEESGHFVLGSDAWNGVDQARLVDVYVASPLTCATGAYDQVLITHEGDGYVFAPLTEAKDAPIVPSLVTMPERSVQKLLWNLTGGESELEAKVKWWLTDPILFRSFDERLASEKKVVPLLGLPLFGTYELAIADGSCRMDSANLKLKVIFAGKWRFKKPS